MGKIITNYKLLITNFGYGLWPRLYVLNAFLSGVVLIFAGAVFADMERSGNLLDVNYLERFTLYSAIGLKSAEVETVGVEDQEFDRAFRISVSEKAKNNWDYSLSFGNTGDIKKGEVVLASFYARISDVESNSITGSIGAVMMEPLPSYAKLAGVEDQGDSQWKQYCFAMTADRDYKKSGLLLLIPLGYGEGTTEIGGIGLVNLGKTSIDSLKLSGNAKVYPRQVKNVTYEGRSPEAAWRKEAFERIEKIRKGDITIIVRDGDGKPVEGAVVEVKQLRHKFYFGNEIRSLIMLSDKAYLDYQGISEKDIVKYKETVREFFNVTAFGQAMVRYYWNVHGRETAVKVYDEWMKPNGVALRGIPLIWSGKQIWKNPEGLMDLGDEKLRKNLKDHMTELMTVLKGRAVMWDVLNEPISEPHLLEKLGKDEAVEWFRLARKLAPDAKLYCNDYGLLADRGKLMKFTELIKHLIEKGAPIDGVSPQSHIFASDSLPSIESIKESFDILAGLGVDVYPDQFEAVISDEQVHADFTRDFYILAFSHPAVVGVTHWGFWEGDIWMSDAAWFARDWSPKPFANVYRDLVCNKWWTDVKGVTGSDGKFMSRGFLGEFEVFVSFKGKKESKRFDLCGDGSKIVVGFVNWE